MFEDVISFETLWHDGESSSAWSRATRAFVRFMEERLGAHFVYDARRVPFGKPELLDLFVIVEKLKKNAVIKSYSPSNSMPDEPPFYAWRVSLASTSGRTDGASGAHASDERLALTAALAEAVERHVWFERTDYFDSPTFATPDEIAARGAALMPERFAGFSEAQRVQSKHLQLLSESKYLWIRGHSWTSNSSVWIPAQVVSGSGALSLERKERSEPTILSNSTNGLATGQTQESALLAGALELIERDAYMIMWLNQLTLPRFDINELCAKRESLAHLVEQCRRYRLKARAIRMLTDAPAYAVCAVLEDLTGNKPSLTLGLRADKDPAYAVEKALMEALRIRQTARNIAKNPPVDWNPEKKSNEVGHMDRLLYWMVADRADKLSFLTRGPVQQFAEPWEQDSDAEHLARVTAWCRERGYEFASVSMTHSAANPTPWYIEMVVIPELQPIHLHERARHLGGKRLAGIPEMFGYTPREESYIDDPHPFA